jgi:hypothetical protein
MHLILSYFSLVSLSTINFCSFNFCFDGSIYAFSSSILSIASRLEEVRITDNKD